MSIKTGSILSKKKDLNTIRICIMRRIKPDYDFDLWIPKLSPPEKLLQDYVIDKKIGWEEFSNKFSRQVIRKNKKLINLLINLSKRNNIILLCAERSAKYCHRSLILGECLKKLKT